LKSYGRGDENLKNKKKAAYASIGNSHFEKFAELA